MRFRVFAALDLARDNQERLAQVVAGLREAAPAGAVRWVRPEAMHLTVKFYGDVDTAALPDLQTALAEAARQVAPLRLSLMGLGVFPHARRPQVLWAGVGGDLEGLHALAAGVEARSAALGYAPESRAYHPHLTLGRVSGSLRPAEQARLLERLRARRDEVFGTFEAGELRLVRSDLRPTGSVYSTLFAAPLGAPRGGESSPGPTKEAAYGHRTH